MFDVYEHSKMTIIIIYTKLIAVKIRYIYNVFYFGSRTTLIDSELLFTISIPFSSSANVS